MREPEDILFEALFEQKREPIAAYACFSGGDDSLVSVHWTMNNIPNCKVLHINTGIGIEATRRFVRDTCYREKWPLIEIRAKEDCGQDYDEMVLKNGFPGPPMHARMYQRLKERPIRVAVKKAKKHRLDKVILSTGLRHDESMRRMGYGGREIDFVGSQMWCNFLYWKPKSWFMEYIAKYKLPRNPVSEILGMSGECLCGAFAAKGEKGLIRIVCPDTADRIERLEVAAGLLGHTWGWEDRPTKKGRVPRIAPGPLCVGCGKSD